MKENILTKEELKKLDEYFRVTNYLSVAQLYLVRNALLKEPLKLTDIKPNVVGHWGTAPGQNFIYIHLNRIIKKYDLNMIYVSGPGHGGQAIVSNVYLEGTYSEVYPEIKEDLEGLDKLLKQFSFPGGISSHVAPETPGSINEGGELGYSLSHAFGAVMDNKDLIAACVVGDGEAETGPLATSWHSNKFINPALDGAVLPILHLNGYKISNPTILARISDEELINLFKGYGYEPIVVEASEELEVHQKMASAMDYAASEIKKIWHNARIKNKTDRPIWPMIILKSPKGWTCPKVIDNKQVENSFRSHQVPVIVNYNNPGNLKLLESWLKSYKVDDLFDESGKLKSELKELAPLGKRRMGANPHANGGLLLENLILPNFKDYAVSVTYPGGDNNSDMTVLGSYIRDVVKLNEDKKNFRIFGPDEALSNRLNAVFEETSRAFNANILQTDEFISKEGRVMDSFLSEHVCEGWLEGYLLTGRHGFLHSYEAFIRIIDSMVSQHAKWLKVTKEIPWRQKISSLNFILTSHVWQQDHNGYTHQDPGFLNHLITKKADTIRMYLPPDANCLLSCFDHVLKTKNYINVIVASKHPRPQWLTMEQAVIHCTNGIGRLAFVSNDDSVEPDLVMAAAGDTPTLEIIAATSILRKYFPELKIRVVNVVDLMKLQTKEQHPHGLSTEEYDAIFTKDKPIIFAFHGYPSLIEQLTFKRTNDMHVFGYNEEGTITTPFDMRVQNKIDRFSLVIEALKHLDILGNRGSLLNQICKDKLVEHKVYIKEHGEDMPEIRNYKWEKLD